MTTSLDSTFASTVSRHPHRPAILQRGSPGLTFARLDQLVGEVAGAIATLDPGPVALAIQSRARLVIVVLAAWRQGRAVVLLDPTTPPNELQRWAPRLGARWLIHEPEGDQPAPEASPRARALDPTLELPAEATLVKVTSGSTGEPVGAVLDAGALLAGIDQIARGMGITGDDRIVVPLPLSHSYGFDSGILSLLALGTPLILESSLYLSSLVSGLNETRGTVLLLVPPLVRALAATAWPNHHQVRLVVSAGGPLEPAFATAFAQAAGVPVHQFYGSTETGGICFEHDPLDPDAGGTVGSPLPGVLVGLDPDARVTVSSSANATALLTGGAVVPIKGPIATGDTAEWTKAGRLRLTGRVAGLLNVAGRRIQAAGLEHEIQRLPGVREAAVIGVPESVRGDRVVVFVVTDGRRLEANTLPRGVRPREVRYVEALPYTERGKLDRRRLLELVDATSPQERE
jgi:acyl-coenzyme A synthetase/AMP-(fatty) acid ligase